jgi:hypothetical protein
MNTKHRTLQGENACRAKSRLHCSPALVKRKAVSTVLSENSHQQRRDPSGSLALLVQAHIAAALARAN